MARVKFGDVVKEVKINVDRNTDNHEYYIAGEHMETENLRILKRGSFSESEVGPAFTRLFKPGQILYGSRRTYLKKVAIADFEGITANTTFVLESKDPSVMIQNLLPFIMLSSAFTDYSVKNSKGSTNPYILFSDIAEYEFDLPDMNVQEQLVDLLMAIEKEQRATEDALSAAIELKASFLDEIYSQKMRVFNEDGLPFDDWKMIPLSDVAEKLSRKNKNNETDRPLTISAIDGLVDQRDYFSKTIASKDLAKYYLLKKGEYAYNKSYSLGYPVGSIKRLDLYDMGALSSLYICFSLKEDVNSDYIKYYFESTCWYDIIYKIVEEGARAHGLLNVSKIEFFNTLHLLSRNKKEQEIIVEKIKAFEPTIQDLKERAVALKALRQSIIDKWF